MPSATSYWTVFHPDADTVVECITVVAFMVLVSVLNLYALAKLLNVCRALASTRAFTKPPLEGGCIAPNEEPVVTIQICCYNEESVIEATINAACSVDWPKEKLHVQVLDDSDSKDDTSNIVEAVAASWREKGIHCVRLTRPNRVGYKAGALTAQNDKIRGDFVALFDADHRYDVNFLRRTMPQFFNKDGSEKKEIGLVQVPWAYYNTHTNLLTEYDALMLDISHVIEQQGRSAALHCFGFNGTGGIWRHRAIQEGGGWKWHTVTEDLDLSYRSHLAGYKFVYLRDIPQQLEVPTNILAHKQQKHRWTKGYWQVLRTSLWDIWTSEHSNFWIRFEAFFHMSSATANPVTLIVIILFAIIADRGIMTLPMIFSCIFVLTVVFTSILCTVYGKVAGTNGHYGSFWSRTLRLGLVPVAVVLGLGMSVYETYAMFDGITSNDATFLRTPKEGSLELHKSNNHTQDLHESQVIDNIVKKKRRGGGLMTEMILVVVGLTLASLFVGFAIVSLMVSEVRSEGALFFAGYLVPASGLFVVHGSVFRALLKRRGLKKASAPTESSSSTTANDTSRDGEPSGALAS